MYTSKIDDKSARNEFWEQKCEMWELGKLGNVNLLA